MASNLRIPTSTDHDVSGTGSDDALHDTGKRITPNRSASPSLISRNRSASPSRVSMERLKSQILGVKEPLAAQSLMNFKANRPRSPVRAVLESKYKLQVRPQTPSGSHSDNEQPSITKSITKSQLYRLLHAIEEYDDTPSQLTVPTSMVTDTMDKPVVPRPNTAAETTGNAPCERVLQVDKEPTRCYKLNPHLPSKKQHNPPSWQKYAESDPIPVVVTPGYILTRSKSSHKTQVYLKTDELRETLDPEIMSSRREDPERDSLITQLQQQIEDLKLFLEEERQRHRETRQNLSEQLKDKSDEIMTLNRNKSWQMRLEFQHQVKDLKTNMEKKMKDLAAKKDAQLVKTQGEMEYLQGAFESYKTQLHLENAERWDMKVQEMLEKFNKDKIVNMEEKEDQLKKHFAQERQEWEVENKHQKAIINREHKKEVEKIIRRFANQAAEQEELQRVKKLLQDKEEEFNQTKDMYEALHQRAEKLRDELEDTRVKFTSFEEKFNERVSEVHMSHMNEINSLKVQNSEIKPQPKQGRNSKKYTSSVGLVQVKQKSSGQKQAQNGASGTKGMLNATGSMASNRSAASMDTGTKERSIPSRKSLAGVSREARNVAKVATALVATLSKTTGQPTVHGPSATITSSHSETQVYHGTSQAEVNTPLRVGKSPAETAAGKLSPTTAKSPQNSGKLSPATAKSSRSSVSSTTSEKDKSKAKSDESGTPD